MAIRVDSFSVGSAPESADAARHRAYGRSNADNSYALSGHVAALSVLVDADADAANRARVLGRTAASMGHSADGLGRPTASLATAVGCAGTTPDSLLLSAAAARARCLGNTELA